MSSRRPGEGPSASEQTTTRAPATPRKPRELAREEQAVREQRGVGFEDAYKAWIQVRPSDFASRGVSQIIPELQGRQQDALSTLEGKLHLLLHYWGAAQVREQKPLALDLDDSVSAVTDLPQNRDAPCSVELAAKNGWTHPKLPGGAPKRLTTDALAEDDEGNSYAFYVRYLAEVPLSPSRGWDLLQLQREYWQSRTIPFLVFTEKHVDEYLHAHLIWAFDGLHTAANPHLDFTDFLHSADFSRPLLKALEGWPEGTSMAVARFKRALLGGTLEVLGSGTRPALLTRPWNVRLAKDKPGKRLKQFVRQVGAAQ